MIGMILPSQGGSIPIESSLPNAFGDESRRWQESDLITMLAQQDEIQKLILEHAQCQLQVCS
jgi:hypothetical protein